VCSQFGYESVALVPIRLGEKILGLIHVVRITSSCSRGHPCSWAQPLSGLA
jgi:hypothetical protein